MSIKINKYTHNSLCDVRRCNNKSEYAIGDPDESMATHYIICKQHLIEIVKESVNFFDDDFRKSILDAAFPEGLKTPESFDELKDELEKTKVKLEQRETVIEELKARLNISPKNKAKK